MQILQIMNYANKIKIYSQHLHKFADSHYFYMEINLELLSVQNPWWQGISLEFDPVVEAYREQPLKLETMFSADFDLKKDRIYFLAAGRGIGKTTIFKNLIKELIAKKKIDPENIFYYSCHNIDTYEQLNELIKIFLNWRGKTRARKFIFIDEITLIKNWQKGINFLDRARKFRGITLFLAGSNLPGKSLPVKAVTKIIASIDFLEFIRLISPEFTKRIGKDLKTAGQRKNNFLKFSKQLDYYLDIYFLTGGFFTGLNSYNSRGGLEQKIYSDHLYWLISDLAKIGRDVSLLRQIMEQVLLKIGQPLGHKTIARRTKAKTHLTVGEYLNILENNFSLKQVYQSDKQGRISKSKAKKVYFRDPFLFWLHYSYIHGALSYWQFSRERLHREEIFSALVENVVFSHLIKDETIIDWGKRVTYWRDNARKKEINFLVKSGRKVTPILIRYNKKVVDQDKNILEQAGFKEGIIISKDEYSVNKNIKVIPLVYFLLFYKSYLGEK